MNKGDRVQMLIDRLALGGDGIGRHQGLVVFVSDVLPGELVEVEIILKKKDYARAVLVSVIEKSAVRQSPPCPYFDRCGGCNWQHISTDNQLLIKKELLETNFMRALKFPVEFNMVASPKDFYYRNRTQFHSQGDAIGFHKKQSHDIVDVNECLISDPEINKCLQELRQGSSSVPPRFEIFLKTDGSAQIAATTYGGSGEGFGQVNSEVNQLLKDQIIKWAQSIQPVTVVELYSGSGNLSFPLIDIPSVKTFYSVESFSRSVEIARTKFDKLKNKNPHLQTLEANFLTGSSELKAPTLLRKNVNLLVVDPPRAGLDSSVVEAIITYLPENVIYVSCDPSTLIRDIRRLTENYKIESAIGFDMFPQTSHVESLLWLTKT